MIVLLHINSFFRCLQTISTRDVAVMKGYVEHLTHLILQRRKIAAEVLSAVSRTRTHETSLRQFSNERSKLECSFSGNTLVAFCVSSLPYCDFMYQMAPVRHYIASIIVCSTDKRK